MKSTRTRSLLAVVLVVATAFFLVGVLIERGQKETHEEEVVETEAGEAHEEAGASEESAGGEGAESREGEAESEEILGIDLESPALITAGVILSLLMAAAALRVGRSLLLLIAFAALAFAILDIREVIHQIEEANPGIAWLATGAAAGHVAAAFLGYRAARDTA